jgi:hypothetical protein
VVSTMWPELSVTVVGVGRTEGPVGRPEPGAAGTLAEVG